MKFTCTGPEDNLITAILNRATPPSNARFGMAMSLEACHSNGTPLDFAALLKSAPIDFHHDLHGIHANTCRATGKLLNLFLPRCARSKEKAS